MAHIICFGSPSVCRFQVQNVQAVQPLRSVQTLTSFLPRVAGEDEGGGLIDLNVLNGHNVSFQETKAARGFFLRMIEEGPFSDCQ